MRITSIDHMELLFLDLPALLERHVRDFDDAEAKAHSGQAHNVDRDSLFNRLQPHLAVSVVPLPSGRGVEPVVDRVYLRALVENLLRLLLPPGEWSSWSTLRRRARKICSWLVRKNQIADETLFAEEYRSEAERAVVREIVTCLIFGAVFDKVAQPWFVHQTLAKVLEADELARSAPPPSSSSSSPASFSLAMLLHQTIDVVSSLPTVLRTVLQSLSALYSTTLSSPLPAQYRTHPPLTTSLLSLLLAVIPPSSLLEQTIHYFQLPLSYFSAFVNSLLAVLVRDKLGRIDVVEGALKAVQGALFPGGHPPPKEEDPSEKEKEDWRRRCEGAVARRLDREFSFVSVLCHRASIFLDSRLAVFRVADFYFSSFEFHVHSEFCETTFARQGSLRGRESIASCAVLAENV